MKKVANDRIVKEIDRYIMGPNAIEKISEKKFAYQYGPYIVSHRDEFANDSDEILKNNATIRFMAIVPELMREEPQRIRTVRDRAIEFLHDSGPDDPYASARTVYAQVLLKRLRAYQMENRVFESAMISTAPIVPYGAIGQFMNLYPDEVSQITPPKAFEVNDHTPLVDYLMEYCDKLQTQTSLPDALDYLLSSYLVDILKYNELTIVGEYDTLANSIKLNFPKLVAFTYHHPNLVPVAAYYFLAWINFQEKTIHFTTIKEYLKEFKNKVLSIGTDQFSAQEAFEFLLQHTEGFISTTELTSTLEFADETIKKQMESIPAYHDPDDEPGDDRFDIRYLSSYVANTRRYKTDTYVNSFFMSTNTQVELSTFYRNDLLICQYENEYIVSPLVDLADSMNVCLVWMDSENNIYVTKGIRIHELPTEEDLVCPFDSENSSC